jgi:hypothetical protein
MIDLTSRETLILAVLLWSSVTASYRYQFQSLMLVLVVLLAGLSEIEIVFAFFVHVVSIAFASITKMVGDV